MRRARRFLPVAYLLAALAVGCGKKSAAPPASDTAVAAAPVAGAATGTGAAVFAQHCQKCHTGGKAPDLSHAGAAHDAAWIAEHTRNPKAHKPQSKMPPFDGKLSPAELTAVAEHLAGLK